MRIYLRIFGLLLLAVMQIADVELTKRGIRENVITEGNPIVRTAEQKIGWSGILAAKLIGILALVACWKSKRFETWLSFILCSYSLLIFYHFLLL